MHKLRQFGKRLFSERDVLLYSMGRIRSISLPGWLQAMIMVVCLAAFGGMSYLTVSYLALRRAVTQSTDISRADRVSAGAALPAKASLNPADIAALNQRLESVNEQYTELKRQYAAAVVNQKAKAAAQQALQQKLDAAERQVSANSGVVTQLTKSVDELRAELKKSEVTRGAEEAHARQLAAEAETLKAKILNLKSLAGSIGAQPGKGGGQAVDPTKKDEPIAPPAAAPASKPAAAVVTDTQKRVQ